MSYARPIPLGHSSRVCDISCLALIIKVMVELNRSDLSICVGGHLFSLKTILGVFNINIL